MRLSQELILFALGKFYEEVNSRFSGKPLKVVISKMGMIDIIYNSNITGKDKEHVSFLVYKLLQKLEDKKMISYRSRGLRFTKKGKREYEKIKRRMQPYLNMLDALQDPRLYKKQKTQTVFNVKH
ncbi:hypothetical protein DRJ25_05505 [Candidatus Woesearchaeota archaeon]|nr:MAG: hypothetical protein DRJ25_05505 [Candidatus Woesearchaeota archaeon]